MSYQFKWWGVLVGIWGLYRLVRLKPSLGHSSLVAFFLISIYSIGYNTTDSYIYLLPAFLIFSLWIGWGLYDLGQRLRQFVSSRLCCSYLIGWSIVCLPLLSLLLNFSEQNISRDDEAYDYARQSLQIVAPGAVIVTDDDPHTFALWYGRYALNWRPDVAIVNINLLPYTWYQQTLQYTHPNLQLSNQAGQPLTTLPTFVEQNLSSTPIYLTTLQPPSTLINYNLEPVKHLQRVVSLADE